MKSELFSLLSFTIGIACRTINELHYHGKLRWESNYIFGFWGKSSYDRKYKVGTNKILPAPDNWYYRFFKIRYKERFPGSATFFVFLTDGMHLMQFFFFLFISLSFAPILGLTWSVIFWGVAHIIHFCVYRYLQK